MKRYIKSIILILITIGLTMPLFAASSSKSKTMYVTLESAQLKAKPAAASKKTGTVEYAEAVVVVKSEKSWVYVELADDSSVAGWLPESALTSKKIKEKAKAASADADEIALAGKGFNSTIEAIFAEEFEVDFGVVDYIESLGIESEEAAVFAREGELNDGGAEE
ncbi:MAG: hypothetical protein K5907_01240 [Treponema sp.]|nr:hypothetical protein [Treponema sp.]